MLQLLKSLVDNKNHISKRLNTPKMIIHQIFLYRLFFNWFIDHYFIDYHNRFSCNSDIGHYTLFRIKTKIMKWVKSNFSESLCQRVSENVIFTNIG